MKELDEEFRKLKAKQSHENAFKRLKKDGSTSSANVRRRLALIANERLLPDAAASRAARSFSETIAFCKAQAVNLDWVLYGDLKGLLRTVQDARSTTPEAELAQSQEVATLFRQLPPHDRNRLLNGLRNMTGAASKRGPAA
ncbi:hypothetical protein AB7M49_008177 [Bradyrhizobium elkanii]